jgi:tetratricopeptide (TPR) repeat protein
MFFAVALLGLVAGCAGGQRLPTDLDHDPLAEEIARFNEEELFTCGTAAWQAEDYPRAAACFARLADRFPQSRHWRDATFNAGAAWEAQGHWLLALDRYRAAMEVEPGPGSDLEPHWRAAGCLYQLDRYEEAIELLAPLTAEPFKAPYRIRAMTHAGICRVEMGQLGPAEIDLRRALDLYRKEERRSEERIDDSVPAQAQYFSGEIYRLHFEAVALQAVDDTEKLGQELEYKAQLLLSAQGHYLRAIRMGNAHWGTAAGQRVGGLYETLYDQMMTAPVPPGMEGREADLYRGLLRRKVRILVQKSISIYERTLSTAERVGARSGFIEQTQASLDRMKEVLLADAARDEAEGITDDDLETPTPTPQPAPDERAQVPDA